MDDKAYIKLSRKMLEWEWYTDKYMFYLITHLLLKSLDTDYVLEISVQSLAADIGADRKTIEKCLSHLSASGMIDVYYSNIEKKSKSKWIIVIRESEFYLGGNCLFYRPDEYIVDFQLRNRETPEYKKFKKAVLSRDKYQCVRCGSCLDLEVHHIKSYAKYPNLRTKVNNGITLCNKCHKEEHRNAR